MADAADCLILTYGAATIHLLVEFFRAFLRNCFTETVYNGAYIEAVDRKMSV
jgi:hypothetical protein